MRSALIMKVFTKLALLLFFISTAAVGAQQKECDIWLAPLDREQNVNGQGAEDFMKLFESDAPWGRVSGHVAAFKIYPYFAGRSSDKNLRKVFIDLRRRAAYDSATEKCSDGSARSVSSSWWRCRSRRRSRRSTGLISSAANSRATSLRWRRLPCHHTMTTQTTQRRWPACSAFARWGFPRSLQSRRRSLAAR